DVALPLAVPAYGHHRPVRPDPDCAAPPGGDGDDVAQSAHLALAVLISPRGEHGPIRPEADGVGVTGVGVADSDRDDVTPTLDAALTVAVVAYGHHGAARAERDGVAEPRGQNGARPSRCIRFISHHRCTRHGREYTRPTRPGDRAPARGPPL